MKYRFWGWEHADALKVAEHGNLNGKIPSC